MGLWSRAEAHAACPIIIASKRGNALNSFIGGTTETTGEIIRIMAHETKTGERPALLRKIRAH